jgi:uncharacterized protein (DUF433 family)
MDVDFTPSKVTGGGAPSVGKEVMGLDPGMLTVTPMSSDTLTDTVRFRRLYIRLLSEKLCEEHPAISTYEGIFGGSPHLKGLRISVADILEQLYLTGSIAGVQKIYSPDLSKDQIKEAIAYAQDFIESAVSSSSEVNA